MKDFLYDYARFMRYSSSVGLNTKETLQAFIVKEYHAVEKGMALGNPRPGFGEVRIASLLNAIEVHESKYGGDPVLDIAFAGLQEYSGFNERNNISNGVTERIKSKLLHYKQESVSVGGTREISKSEITEALDFDFGKFIKSRFSIRDFSEQPVNTADLLAAIDLAKYAPSACNRQAWKVYLIEHSNKEFKSKILDIQNGNKGFREQISALLVITGKLSSFGDYERNQSFIDGGMFAMSLLLALHSKGLGTCCLNNSFTAAKNKLFCNIMNISEDNVPIMFIAVGHLKNNFKVAMSARKTLDEIVTIR
ncbi:MAG: nitroreductase family protein [Ferruginibacter sp.]